MSRDPNINESPRTGELSQLTSEIHISSTEREALQRSQNAVITRTLSAGKRTPEATHTDVQKRQRTDPLTSVGTKTMQKTVTTEQNTAVHMTQGYPLRINNHMVLHRPGTVVADEGFHTNNALFPVNYCLLREFQSMADPQRTSYWRCEITFQHGAAIFSVTEDSHPQYSYSLRNIDQVIVELRNTFHVRHNVRFQPIDPWSGIYFFGLDNPMILDILENQLINNNIKCHNYISVAQRNRNTNFVTNPTLTNGLNSITQQQRQMVQEIQQKMSQNAQRQQQQQQAQQQQQQQVQASRQHFIQQFPFQQQRQLQMSNQLQQIGTHWQQGRPTAGPIAAVTQHNSIYSNGTAADKLNDGAAKAREYVKAHRSRSVDPIDYHKHLQLAEKYIEDHNYFDAAVYSFRELLSKYLTEEETLSKRFWNVIQRCFKLIESKNTNFSSKRLLQIMDVAASRIDVWSEEQIALIIRHKQMAQQSAMSIQNLEKGRVGAKTAVAVNKVVSVGQQQARQPITLSQQSINFYTRMSEEQSLNDTTVEKVIHLVADQPVKGPEYTIPFDISTALYQQIVSSSPTQPALSDSSHITCVAIQMYDANDIQSHGQKPIYYININGIVLPPKFQYREAYHINKLCKPGRNFVKITSTPHAGNNTPVYILSIVLREYLSPDQLLQRTKLSPKPSTTIIINAIKQTFMGDKEVEQISLPLSLRCPISRNRIVLPGRSTLCRHVQAFCLLSFIRYSIKYVHTIINIIK